MDGVVTTVVRNGRIQKSGLIAQRHTADDLFSAQAVNGKDRCESISRIGKWVRYLGIKFPIVFNLSIL